MHMQRQLQLLGPRATGSAVYLFKIGHIHVLNNNEENNTFIAKYGYSIDLSRRSKEHARLYGASIQLTNKSLVAPRYLREAEWVLRRSFADAGMIMSKNNRLHLPAVMCGSGCGSGGG